MRTLRSILGYAAAAMGVPIVMAMLMLLMNGTLAEMVVGATGLTVAANINGGEVVKTIDHGAYRAEVHRMVFDGFLGERREGFVQVDWAPLDALPAELQEAIDADGDGQVDFSLQVDTAGPSAALDPIADWVLSLEGPHTRSESLAVRVLLRNPNR